MVQSTGPTIGDRIARLRGSRMTQAALARSAGVSVDLIRKLEQGRRHTVSISNLHRIARALDVDAAALLSGHQPLVAASEHAGAVAIRRALTSIDHLVGESPDLEPLTIEEARRTLSYGWGAYWGGHYDTLGHLLPGAIGQIHASLRAGRAVDAPAAHDLAAQLYNLAASTLVHLGYVDVAHLALREALRLAELGSDPLRPAALRMSLAWVLLVQGRWSESYKLATVSAADLAPRPDSPLPTWSLYGLLLITGATAVGRDGNRSVAGALLDEAAQAAQHTGDRNDFEMMFGPDKVTMMACDVETVTENYGGALTVARAMPPDTSLPVAARARHLSDVALAHTRLGHDDDALDILHDMESLAPEWMRYQSEPRQIVRELRERAANPPRLTALATRIGVLQSE